MSRQRNMNEMGLCLHIPVMIGMNLICIHEPFKKIMICWAYVMLALLRKESKGPFTKGGNLFEITRVIRPAVGSLKEPHICH